MKNAIYLHISVPNIFNMLWQCLLVWSLFWKFSNLGENWDNEEMRSNVEMRSAQYSLAIPEWSLEEIWVSFHPVKFKIFHLILSWRNSPQMGSSTDFRENSLTIGRNCQCTESFLAWKSVGKVFILRGDSLKKILWVIMTLCRWKNCFILYLSRWPLC